MRWVAANPESVAKNIKESVHSFDGSQGVSACLPFSHGSSTFNLVLGQRLCGTDGLNQDQDSSNQRKLFRSGGGADARLIDSGRRKGAG